MTQVTVGENEGIESALRRFKRQVSKAGIFADLKRLRHHETPIEKYKRKAQQRRWLPSLASGDAIATPAWLEPDRGYGPNGVASPAQSPSPQPC